MPLVSKERNAFEVDSDGGSPTQNGEKAADETGASADTCVTRETGAGSEVKKNKDRETETEQDDDDRELEDFEGIFVSPVSRNLTALVRLEKDTLEDEQRNDPSLKDMPITLGDGAAKTNVSFYVKDGLQYRNFKDSKGRSYDQLIVPEKYREDLLHLCHTNAWSGHLGVTKTKERLLQEYWWPGYSRAVVEYVKSCDTCQRVGKPNKRCKAPLKRVPLIAEPFRRLVIDIVGPLPVTQSGYKYILTMLCPATKFPEAVLLRQVNSPEIVDALLAVFARIGFPSEIQSDQGTVFTSALTTEFFERCGIRVIHSSVCHPQSNSVERWHSVLKRVLRALCHERVADWEACLPAALFALRTASHESTGFSPAELVYGRALRSPLRMLREKWEGHGEETTVVEYVINLLERMHTARETVMRYMEAAQNRGKAYYDRNARLRSYKEGDKVMVLRPARQNKLQVHWEGPVEVVNKLSETNYIIKMTGRRKELRIYHTNLIEPYVERQHVESLALNVREEMPLDIPEIAKECKSYTVEEVTKKAVKNGELNESQMKDIEILVSEFIELFTDRPGSTDAITHDIELTSEQVIRSQPYRTSPRQKEIIEEEVNKMLVFGIIEPGNSDFASPILLVEVPGKNPRPCIDYRRLNAVTKDLTYPISNIEERVEKVSGAKYISTIDLVRGYWQVPLTDKASRYAAFITHMGTFRPRKLAFGLKNAPFCFSQLMDRVLRGLESYALPYLDDVAIFSNTWEEHLAHLRSVFQRLKEAGLTVKTKKCHLGGAEVEYLCHIVGQGKRRPLDLKIAAVKEFPKPVTKTDIRSFLGLTGYYQHYIANYSEIASPRLTRYARENPRK
ncbi:uncharacterized protein LOC135374410 [Ornithodoros turicata]|uniref:uncharacterized protein LOC135374410 n=1 Tax=Ornithodoros turicata TaxID=34597 RepID=UPI003139BB49